MINGATMSNTQIYYWNIKRLAKRQ